jgi:Tetratricopeptide repeat
LVNRGNVLIRLKRAAEALESYDTALALEPDHAAGLTDRGIALTLLDRFDEALACHDRALSLQPSLIAGHINRGNTLGCLARFEEALACYDDALALDPDHAEAQFNASLTRLGLGDFREGWAQYESRWRKKGIKWQPWEFPQPQWDGKEDLHGKTMLLVAEQGMGDTIQFIRYVPLVAALGARIVVGVQRPLKRLMATVPGIADVRSEGDELPEFDMHCPLLTLPRWFETDLSNIPSTFPYLLPLPEHIRKWHGRLPQNNRLRVGIVWAGNSAHGNDRNRSMPLEKFAPLLSVPGVDFISVQREVNAAQAEILDAHGVVRFGHEFMDFADTAAIVAMLDLLISVDTSVAHLAGAMGKAVGLLIPFAPDWRWLCDRSDTKWYPSMRIFRQRAPSDWDELIDRVRNELSEAAARRLGPR